MPVTTRNQAARGIVLGTLIDRSGSMEDMNPTETVNSINQVIKEQSEQGDLTYYGGSFDSHYTMFLNGAKAPIREITVEDIQPRGITALYSAIGNFVTDISTNAPTGVKVVIVILTDGMNNSHPDRWTQSSVKQLITNKREQDNWEFIFMGANQDAVLVGNDLGISKNSSVTYSSNSQGITTALRCMSDAVTRTRTGQDADVSFTQQERFESCNVDEPSDFNSPRRSFGHSPNMEESQSY